MEARPPNKRFRRSLRSRAGNFLVGAQLGERARYGQGQESRCACARSLLSWRDGLAVMIVLYGIRESPRLEDDAREVSPL